MRSGDELTQRDLELGELEITARLVDASNATLFGSCTYQGRVREVIYKPIAGERPLWDFPEGNLAFRELAAYLISRFSGWDVVPVTIVRNGPFGEGMVQEWIDIDESIDLASFYRTDDQRLRRIALFDVVVNNTDRKIGHLLPNLDGHLYGCDHGVTFHSEFKLRTVLWQWAEQELSERERADLLKLSQRVLDERHAFEPLITDGEFSALLGRIDSLLNTGTFPAPSEDWPAIPWPPF